jgi:DNA relaxase NicK
VHATSGRHRQRADVSRTLIFVGRPENEVRHEEVQASDVESPWQRFPVALRNHDLTIRIDST